MSKLDDLTVAMRVAKEVREGEVVNLGYGLAGVVANFILEERNIVLHTENGALGFGPIAAPEEADDDLINASGQPVTRRPGMALFDQAESFDMIRGGHVDVVVLGAYQVSERGDLANWTTPFRKAPSIGGAMDLAMGAKRVIVAMSHVAPDGSPKIVKKCTYPLTAKECVSFMVTDMAVIEVTKEGLLLKEIAPGFTHDEIQQVTEPRFIISPDLKEVEL